MAQTKRISVQEIPTPATYALENALLGALIGNPYYIAEARATLSADSFEDTENQKIWTWLCERDDNGDDINERTAIAKLNSRHFIDNILPHMAGTMTLSEMGQRIRLVEDAAKCSRAYKAGFEMMLKASHGEANAVMDICRTFMEDTAALMRDDESKQLETAINEFAEELTKREEAAKRGEPLRVTTSFTILDRYTDGGFARGNLVIVAARPSVGKTAVALQMAKAAAISRIPTLFFSLEMTNDELIQRMIRSNCDMTGYQLAHGDVDWQKFEWSTGKFCKLPLLLNDKAVYFDDICSKILNASRSGQCGIVFIDYLGLIAYREKSDSLYRQVTECTRRLKQLAKSCNIPIVLLCQLNRDMSKEGRAPQLHDLRDSGSIEQDADIVLMLERQITADLKKSRILNMYVRKNRQGIPGHCLHLLFDKSFSNLAEIGEDKNYTVDIDHIEDDEQPF